MTEEKKEIHVWMDKEKLSERGQKAYDALDGLSDVEKAKELLLVMAHMDTRVTELITGRVNFEAIATMSAVLDG